MNAVIVWGLFLLLIFSMAYVLNHKSEFDTVLVRDDGYYYFQTLTTKYGGTFKTPGYKLRHNAVMFAEEIDMSGLTKRLMIVDTEFKDFVRNGQYLFRQGQRHRIATCKTTDKYGTFPPIFDGHETLITHDCLGYVVGELNPKTGEIKMY